MKVFSPRESIILPCNFHIFFAALQPLILSQDDGLVELLSRLSAVLQLLLLDLILALALQLLLEVVVYDLPLHVARLHVEDSPS